MKYKLKKGWVIIVVVVFVLILLNPGMKRFKEFSGFDNKKMGYVTRNYNFIVCSIYEDTDHKKKYFGILLNFIDITPKKQSQSSNKTIILNSTDTIKVNPFLKTTGQTTVKMIFPNGAIKDVDESDIATAQSLGAKVLVTEVDSSSFKPK